MRTFRHLFDLGAANRRFPPATLDAIQHAIHASEHTHLGEVVFAVEGTLSLPEVLRKRSPRDRAREVFAQLRVWNTTHNTGVLVYVLLAERYIEIVADRGIAAKVPESEWNDVCSLMRKHFASGDYRSGAIAGVEAITAILKTHFPADGRDNPDELPDRPVLL